MPKKAHGRPAKARNRTRRPVSRPVGTAGGIASADEDLIAERVPVTTAGPPLQPARSTPMAAATARRAPPGARRAPTTVVNYQYLRRDISTLSVLAPTMIVVLIVLFFVLHY